MRLEYTERQQRFRKEVREWLEQNVPKQPLRSFDTEEGFAEACDVAVAEDAEHPFDEAVFDAVALGVLDGEEADESLSDGQAAGGAGVTGVISFAGLTGATGATGVAGTIGARGTRGTHSRTPGFTRAVAVYTAAAKSPSGG